MDDERLKQGGNRYFKELLQRIRDIRSSERNFYQQVTDIYATSTDYDPRSKTTKLFFSTVQNKMHYAVHEHTAAELIYERVDNEKPFVGMTNFKGSYVTQRGIGLLLVDLGTDIAHVFYLPIIADVTELSRIAGFHLVYNKKSATSFDGDCGR